MYFHVIVYTGNFIEYMSGIEGSYYNEVQEIC